MAQIRFHLDENVSNAIATALRRIDIEVSTTPEAKLLGQATKLNWSLLRPKDESL